MRARDYRAGGDGVTIRFAVAQLNPASTLPLQEEGIHRIIQPGDHSLRGLATLRLSGLDRLVGDQHDLDLEECFQRGDLGALLVEQVGGDLHRPCTCCACCRKRP